MAYDKSRTVTSKSPVVRVLDLDNFDVPVGEQNIAAIARNLRIATWRNKINCSSKYKGVTKNQKGKNCYWIVSAGLGGQNKPYQASFSNEKIAAMAYDKIMQVIKSDAILNKEIYPEDFE